MKYAVIIEKGPASFGAYAPDLPGCAVVAETRQEVIRLIQETIEYHLQDLKERGEDIPPAITSIEFVDVAA